MYEWDEAQLDSNLRKRGLDFNDADIVYENPNKITVSIFDREDALAGYRPRRATLHSSRPGLQGSKYNIRIISFRRAPRKERQIYDNLRQTVRPAKIASVKSSADAVGQADRCRIKFLI